MNVESGAEAAQFPEKEYINGIFVAVHGAQLNFGDLYPYFTYASRYGIEDVTDCKNKCVKFVRSQGNGANFISINSFWKSSKTLRSPIS
jgi:hypothetical protein